MDELTPEQIEAIELAVSALVEQLGVGMSDLQRAMLRDGLRTDIEQSFRDTLADLANAENEEE